MKRTLTAMTICYAMLGALFMVPAIADAWQRHREPQTEPTCTVVPDDGSICTVVGDDYNGALSFELSTFRPHTVRVTFSTEYARKPIVALTGANETAAYDGMPGITTDVRGFSLKARHLGRFTFSYAVTTTPSIITSSPIAASSATAFGNGLTFGFGLIATDDPKTLTTNVQIDQGNWSLGTPSRPMTAVYSDLLSIRDHDREVASVDRDGVVHAHGVQIDGADVITTRTELPMRFFFSLLGAMVGTALAQAVSDRIREWRTKRWLERQGKGNHGGLYRTSGRSDDDVDANIPALDNLVPPKSRPAGVMHAHKSVRPEPPPPTSVPGPGRPQED